MRQSETSRYILFTVFLFFIAVNLLLLDLKVFSEGNPVRLSNVATTAPVPTAEITAQTITNLCPASCVSLISEATKTAATKTVAYVPPATSVHEYYIPLGSGSTQKNKWDDQTSTDTLIDPANYGNVKEAYFTAILRNPTLNGEVDAQLYNVTDNHPVWFSQIAMNGPSVQALTSAKITLDKGAKLYRVQLKSGLEAQVSFDTAKIRIVTE